MRWMTLFVVAGGSPKHLTGKAGTSMQSLRLALAFALTLCRISVSVAQPSAPAASIPPNACDRLAGPPPAVGVRFHLAGVAYDRIDGTAAHAACQTAMQDWPSEVRFVLEAAWAAEKSGDLREAVQLYQIAINRGDPTAAAALGEMYQTGQGVPKDEAAAVRLYTLAADRGDPAGRIDLGRMFETGRGVHKDET